MKYLRFLRPRTVVLFILWSLPIITCLVIGVIAVYQTGWLLPITWTLPVAWLLAWSVSRLWKPPRLQESAAADPLKAPEFWTPQDAAAIAVVEQYRREVPDINRLTIGDYDRYIMDAQTLAQRLARHYHAREDKSSLHRVTLVEVLAVIHLAVEDMEAWVLKNVPGSGLATVGHLQRLPGFARAVDIGWTVSYFASAIANPAKLLTYPLWRQAGLISLELQDEAVRVFYQVYLRRVGYYLIEMYSGRLKGGSRVYRKQFGTLAKALHRGGGDVGKLMQLDDVSTTIAVIGQVKAGKSSLINALMQDKVAATSVLPQTRDVQRYQYPLPGSRNAIVLLDTPGYGEADVTPQHRKEIRAAGEAADIVLLVLAANSAARQSDLQAVAALVEHYDKQQHLNPPTIIAVLTHIDLLRPVREWSPPYNWQSPVHLKEQSIANAVAYTRELFGDSIAQCVCVYTGESHHRDGEVAETLVPVLVKHLDQGRAAAMLKAFYDLLSRNRMEQLTAQIKGLFKTVGRTVLDSALRDDRSPRQ